MKRSANILMIVLFFVLMGILWINRKNSNSETYAPTAIAVQDHFSFANLLSLIENQKVSSVEELLPLLPKEFLRNYTLIKKSSSLQKASVQAPRTILFGETAHLILSFNGSNEQEGFGAVETAEYDEANKKIFFREILFKKNVEQQIKKQDRQLIEEEIQLNNDRVVVSQPNPSKCLVCHADKPFLAKTDSSTRYIWNPYRRWQGFFGEDDDYQNPQDPDFVKYRAQAEVHPRYKYLVNEDENSKSFPYHEVDPKKPFTAEDKDRHNMGLMPNARALLLMDIHYAQQTATQITSDPIWKAIGDNFVKFVLGCEDSTNLQKAFNSYLNQNKTFQQDFEKRMRLAKANKIKTDFLKNGEDQIFLSLGWIQPKFNFYASSSENFDSGIGQPFFNGTSLQEVVLQALLETDPLVRAYLTKVYKENPYKDKELNLYTYGVRPRTIRALNKGFVYLNTDYDYRAGKIQLCKELQARP